MEFDQKAIRERADIIRQNLIRLEEIRQTTWEDFQADYLKVEASKHLLQTAIEAMIDICAHFVARLRLNIPKDSAGLVRALEKAGLLPKEHADKYVHMVRFRNLLVHLYAEVDDRQVYDILQNNLDDFRTFIADAWRIAREKGQRRPPAV